MLPETNLCLFIKFGLSHQYKIHQTYFGGNYHEALSCPSEGRLDVPSGSEEAYKKTAPTKVFFKRVGGEFLPPLGEGGELISPGKVSASL